MQLYIGNKNYSSWSLRSWLLLKQSGIEFEEIRLRFDFSEGSVFKTTLASVAPTSKVPVLVDEGFAVWDTQAIAEYLAEKYPHKHLWPAEVKARARARCLCAEMHAGFGALRSHFAMNIEASLPDIGVRILREMPAVQAELDRIVRMWTEALHDSGGSFLFGDFSIADASFAPVCSRITTYALPVPAAVSAYVQRVLALPAMQQWSAEARAERDYLTFDEPYRSQV